MCTLKRTYLYHSILSGFKYGRGVLEIARTYRATGLGYGGGSFIGMHLLNKLMLQSHIFLLDETRAADGSDVTCASFASTVRNSAQIYPASNEQMRLWLQEKHRPCTAAASKSGVHMYDR